MKLTVTKLGRIEHAEIDIRPLTVFVGPNGTNKTWTAYALYGLLRLYSAWIGSSPGSSPLKDFAVRQRQLHRFREQLRGALGSVFAALAQENVPERIEADLHVNYLEVITSMGAPGGRFPEESLRHLLRLDLPHLSEAEAMLMFGSEDLARRASQARVLVETSLGRLTLRTTYRDTRGDTSTVESVLTGGPLSEDRILEFLERQFAKVLGHVWVFPAERKGLIISLPALTEQVYQIVPAPLGEFLYFLRLASGLPRTENEPARELSRLLAVTVGGEISYTPDEVGKRLVFRMPSGATLPLVSSSSLSRAVAGLSIYLQHFVKPDDVLIIDELEMNAHPEAQMGLVELIAALVQQHVRVVFTTHSPYIVDHLNNLMEASRVPADRQPALARKFSLGTPSAFISPDLVAVHAFEEESPGGNVVVREVLNRETGLIDWSTFGRVSDRVSNLYSDVLAALPRPREE